MPIADMAIETKYETCLTAIYSAFGGYSLSIENDILKATSYLNDAAKYAQETRDNYCLWMAHLVLGDAHRFDCQFEKSLDYFKSNVINLADRFVSREEFADG
ncbi:hypothetical protein ACFL0Q_04970, partial [Thermodesulfobacteriota bacterium]